MVCAAAGRTVDITAPAGESLAVAFSYSVRWKHTPIQYDHRMDRYSRYSFLPQHLEVCASVSERS